MLSCLPVSLFGDIIAGTFPLSEWSRAAASMGLDAFDISILFVRDRTPAGVARLLKDVEAGGLPLSMVAVYPDFTNPDEMYRKKQVIKCLSDICIASDLGARYMRITAGQYYPGEDEDKALDNVLKAFEECAAFAGKCGIRLLWENHSKPGAWENPDFNYETGRLLKMRERLRGSSVRMNFDVANAYLLDLKEDFLRDCLLDIETIHLNDVASKDPIRFAGIGDGAVPIKESLKFLKDNGFTGQISIEEASFEGIEGIRKYVSVTQGLLKQA